MTASPGHVRRSASLSQAAQARAAQEAESEAALERFAVIDPGTILRLPLADDPEARFLAVIKDRIRAMMGVCDPSWITLIVANTRATYQRARAKARGESAVKRAERLRDLDRLREGLAFLRPFLPSRRGAVGLGLPRGPKRKNGLAIADLEAALEPLCRDKKSRAVKLMWAAKELGVEQAMRLFKDHLATQRKEAPSAMIENVAAALARALPKTLSTM